MNINTNLSQLKFLYKCLQNYNDGNNSPLERSIESYMKDGKRQREFEKNVSFDLWI
jgi:hypothetical protein